jgi:uncharacterized protein (DUF2237 family)
VQLNVLGGHLQACCTKPMTGFYRDGFCNTGREDLGVHTVCVEVDDAFLAYSKSVGNDLSTPFEAYNFPGLKSGDCWCLCAERWLQAFKDGMAPKVILSSSNIRSLDFIPLEVLMEYALDLE